MLVGIKEHAFRFTLVLFAGVFLATGVLSIIPAPAYADDSSRFTLVLPDLDSADAQKIKSEISDTGIGKGSGGLEKSKIISKATANLPALEFAFDRKASDGVNSLVYASSPLYCIPNSSDVTAAPVTISASRPNDRPSMKFLLGVTVKPSGVKNKIFQDTSYKTWVGYKSDAKGSDAPKEIYLPGVTHPVNSDEDNIPSATLTHLEYKDHIDAKGQVHNNDSGRTGLSERINIDGSDKNDKTINALHHWGFIDTNPEDWKHLRNPPSEVEKVNDFQKHCSKLIVDKSGNNSTSNYQQLSPEDKVAWDDVAGTSVRNASAGSPGSPDDPAMSCDVKFSDPTSWFICPLVNIMYSATEALDNIINDLLTIDTVRIFDDKDSDSPGFAYRNAWSGFRNIALGLITIAGLVVIIGTAFGYEILDAYTLRKVLPRILLSVLFITLSWDILEFLVNFSNDVGNGVRSLIYIPFSGGTFDQETLGTGAMGLNGLLVGTGLLLLGPAGLFSFVGTALLAAFIAFLVLIIRELIVTFLVIVAPIGIALLILPNTRKGWQLWQNSLSTMLLAFPIIAGIIATGRVFSMVAAQDSNTIGQIIAFIAYFLPYFILPFAFRLAGGAMAQLAGLANDSGRGGFDRLKNFRQGQSDKNLTAMKNGNRFKASMLGTRTLGSAFNRTSVGLSTGVSGRFGMGQRGAEAVSQRRAMAGLELMKDPKWATIKDDDGALRAATYSNASAAFQGVADHYENNEGMNRAEAEQMARHSVAAVQTSVGFGRPQAAAATQAMVDTGTSYTNIQDMAQTIARASAGNTSTAASLAGYANAKTKTVGRNDLAPGFGTLNNLALQEMGALGNGPGPSQDAYRGAMNSAWNSASLYQHANNKPQNLRAAVNHFQQEFNSGDNDRMRDSAVFFEELKEMKSNSHGEARNIIVDALGANEERIDGYLRSNVLDENQQLVPREYIDRNGVTRTRATTMRDQLSDQNRIREYRRPDPNNM